MKLDRSIFIPHDPFGPPIMPQCFFRTLTFYVSSWMKEILKSGINFQSLPENGITLLSLDWSRYSEANTLSRWHGGYGGSFFALRDR